MRSAPCPLNETRRSVSRDTVHDASSLCTPGDVYSTLGGFSEVQVVPPTSTFITIEAATICASTRVHAKGMGRIRTPWPGSVRGGHTPTSMSVSRETLLAWISIDGSRLFDGEVP